MKTGSKDVYIQVRKTDMDEIESVSYYRWPFHSSNKNLKGTDCSTTRRALLLLIGVFILPATIIFPLYMKHRWLADVTFLVRDSDVMWIADGISPYFCEAHSLRAKNSTFSAYQIYTGAVESRNIEKKKYFRLQKNVTLPADSLKYWRFSLNQKTTVNITVCSKHNEAKMVIFKGEKDFRACGLENYAEQKNVEDGYQRHDLQDEQSTNSERHHLEDNESDNSKSSSNESSFSNDESNFEKLLKICLKEDILIHKLPPVASQRCTTDNVQILEHYVHEEDYYFYVLYSEQSNEIDISFDLLRPTHEYGDYVQHCVNKSQCRFSLSLLSQHKVIVEMPKRDRSEPNVHKLTELVSSCEPRKLTYIIFTIVVLFLILLCAFM